VSLSIEPCLWIDPDQAQEAVQRYVDLIPGSRINIMDTFENSGPNLDEAVRVFEFELAGRRIQAIGARSDQELNPAISLKFASSDRETVERVGAGLLEGGFELMAFGSYPWSEYFGWVTDRFGVTWQVLVEPVETPTVAPAMTFVRDQYGHAREAIELYTSLFPDSSIDVLQLFGDDAPAETGKVLFSMIHLAGHRFDITDSGAPHNFDFNHMVSLAVMCDGQEEVDRYWDGLIAAGGQPEQCGWLKDRFGVSWQIVPRRLNELLRDDDPVRTAAVMRCMLDQVKIDVSELEAAYNAS
jgi:predicted 3-demethylubiquinone-9 3-methyltransferase (glyoxalase superfamily)